jgi:hypothetical protein
VVSVPQVIAAGFASTVAAFFTSTFGVAGTMLGAALTAMIITGGSTILGSYLENLPRGVRTLRGRPDLRENFISRMRVAIGWFSRLPPLRQRPILIKGLIAATVAFVIGMGAVYGVEKVIGNSLSCGLWAKCPTGATPGIHLGGGDATGASSTINFGRVKTNAAPQNGTQSPLQNTPAPQNRTQSPLQNTAAPQNGTQNPFRQQTPNSSLHEGTTPLP